MAIKKISQLNYLTNPHANTSNTVLLAVDYYASPDETKQITLGDVTRQAISGFTANGIIYANQSGYLTSTPSALYHDVRQKRIGINTTTPTANLDVHGDILVTGNTNISGTLSVVGNVDYSGTVTTVNITGESGEFFGYTANGFTALYAGIPSGYLEEPNSVFQITSDSNGYAALNMQNINDGELSSSDIFWVADNGSSTEGYLDIGIGSSTYNYPDYGLIGFNDAYIISAGVQSTGGGDLIIGTQYDNDIVFSRYGFNSQNEVMRIGTGNNVVVKGNVQGYNVSSFGINLLPYANAIFASSNVAFNFANTVNVYAYSAYAFANTVNVKAQSAFTNSNSAFTHASAAYNQGNNAVAIAGAAFTNSNSAFTHASAAYNKANSALANTSGTIFGGNLTVSGNITPGKIVFSNDAQINYLVSASPATFMISTANAFTISSNNRYGLSSKEWSFGTDGVLITPGGIHTSGGIVTSGSIISSNIISIINSSFSSGQSALKIVGSQDGTTFAPSQNGYMMHVTGLANTPTRVVVDSFGYGGAYSLLAGRTARGTPDAPLASANGDVLLRLSGNGYGTTGFAPLGVARIDIVAGENYTDSARGSHIKFYNMGIGSNVVQQIASFNANNVVFTGTVEPQKGFAYTPRILAASQTAITIDFTSDSMIKANCAADCTFSFTNYYTGKIVEVWLTNTSGVSRTITHGCSALNSTVNSTTFTLPSTSSAYLKYFSIDGDLANTFVSIVYA
jgi:hypothetical protein